jgi:hypothetical protein
MMIQASPALKNGIRFKRHVRKEGRKPLIGSVLFTLPSPDREERYLTGLTADVSASGIGLHTYEELPVGLIITLHNKVMGAAPRRAGVMWSRQESAGVYRAGLSFV